jgi:protein O-mannosyl-transferase
VTRARRRVTSHTGSSKQVSPPAPRHSDSSWHRSSWVLAAGLTAAVLAVYAPALNNGFINFDDPQYVLENPHVRSGLTWQGAVWAMTAGYAGNWHPVTWLSHMTDVRLFDLHPRGHHATSIVIHLLNTVLLFALLRRMTAEPLRSAVVAGFFGVHPLHVESVAWVAERKDVLSTLFAMLTLWTYVRYVEKRSAGRYGLVLLFFALGLAAKPMLVTLPFLLLLLDIWPLARLTPAREDRRSGLWYVMRTSEFRALLLEKTPLFLVALASSVLTYALQHNAGAVRSFEALPVQRRLTNALVAYGGYIVKTIWPTDLAPLYPYSPTEPLWRIALAAVTMIGLTVFAARAATRYRYAAVGWLWYLGMLVPVIGLVQVGSQPMADRYTYLPIVGLFIVIVWGVSDALEHAPAGRYLLASAATAVIFVSIIMARQQAAVWANSVDLWQHTLRVTSNNYRAHNNLAQALAAGGKPTDALSHYQAALGINPDSVEALTGIAGILAATGRLEDAVAHYRRALQVRPDDTTARVNLGAALAEQRKFVDGPDPNRWTGWLA